MEGLEGRTDQWKAVLINGGPGRTVQWVAALINGGPH